MRNRRRHLLLLSLASLWLISPLPDNQCRAGTPGDTDLNSVVLGLEANYLSFKQLTAFNYHATLTHEQFSPPRYFAFSDQLITYKRKGKKLTLLMTGHSVRNDGALLTRIAAWDEKVSTYRIDSEKDLYIDTNVHPMIFYHNSLMNYIYFPDGSGSTPKNLRTGESQDQDHWLPESLRKNLKKYRLRPGFENVGESQCIVVEVPNEDKLFVDSSWPHLLRSRELFRKDTKHLMERTILSDYKAIGTAWLPAKVVFEEYAAKFHVDAPDQRLLCRRTILVDEFTDLAADDREFRLSINHGDQVHDKIRRKIYLKTDPSANLLDQALPSAKAHVAKHSRTNFNLLVGGIVVSFATCLAIAILRKSKMGNIGPRVRGSRL